MRKLVERIVVTHGSSLPLAINVGESDGNPLQCSCLENPRDGGAWWAAVYGVAQSRTRLKRLSSSSSSPILTVFDLEQPLGAPIPSPVIPLGLL